jgi:hypothetical protein
MVNTNGFLMPFLSMQNEKKNYNLVRNHTLFILLIAVPKAVPQYRPEVQPVRRREPLGYTLWQEDKESAPVFTFLLRPRVMQIRQTCKLLCCLSGKPLPTVGFTWNILE